MKVYPSQKMFYFLMHMQLKVALDHFSGNEKLQKAFPPDPPKCMELSVTLFTDSSLSLVTGLHHF